MLSLLCGGKRIAYSARKDSARGRPVRNLWNVQYRADVVRCWRRKTLQHDRNLGKPNGHGAALG